MTTCPSRSAADSTASGEKLFGTTAAEYARYRPGVPDAAVRLLAATLLGVLAPMLLARGTGTARIPRALLSEVPRSAHVNLVDFNQGMLAQAMAEVKKAVPGACSVSAYVGDAHTLTPRAPERGSDLFDVARQDAAAILANGSLAYLTHRMIEDVPARDDRLTEFFVHAYGPAAEDLAERFAQCVRTWDREVRESGYPPMTVHPAGTPDDQLPPGDVLDKPCARLVFRWPGRTAAAQDLLTAGGQRA